MASAMWSTPDDEHAMVAAAMTLKLNVRKSPSGQIVRVDEPDPFRALDGVKSRHLRVHRLQLVEAEKTLKAKSQRSGPAAAA